LFKVFSRFLNC